jgi:hypothetical protein
VGYVACSYMYMWEGKIKMDLKEIGCENVYWVRLAYNRIQWRTVVKTVM